MQSLLEADRIIGHYSNRIIYPDDYYPVCHKCDEYAEYEVLGHYYCSSCISDVAIEDERNEDEYCEYCGSDEETEGIRINGDFYCQECFEKSFRR